MKARNSSRGGGGGGTHHRKILSYHQPSLLGGGSLGWESLWPMGGGECRSEGKGRERRGVRGPLARSHDRLDEKPLDRVEKTIVMRRRRPRIPALPRVKAGRRSSRSEPFTVYQKSWWAKRRGGGGTRVRLGEKGLRAWVRERGRENPPWLVVPKIVQRRVPR